MNKQEIIEKIKEMTVETFFSGTLFVKQKEVINLIEQLDEPQAGRAEEAPRYVKNIIARLRELPLHDREVWLKAIMSEFEQDFSHAKWREGYEQGRIESMTEREKVKIPEFVENYIKDAKFCDWDIQDAMKCMDDEECTELLKWFYEEKNMETFARAWLDGYEVEKEKQYRVKMLGVNEECECLVFGGLSNTWKLRSLGSFGELRKHHTRKELEEAGFGWVFDCEGIEVEEVE